MKNLVNLLALEELKEDLTTPTDTAIADFCNSVVANWSGRYPNLCRGSWELAFFGENVSGKMPEGLRTSDMNTLGWYPSWAFDKDGQEDWESYEGGLPMQDWIEANYDWLKSITLKIEEMALIFEAFQSEDWRRGQCGGCI